MLTASVNALEQIKELHDRASELKSTFESEYTGILQKISEVAAGKQVAASPSASPSVPRKTASVAVSSVTAPAPKRRGRPPGSKSAYKKAEKAEKTTTETTSQRNYSNDMTLKEAIFNVLDRDNWNGILTLEPDVVSLSAGEIKKVIMTEKKWVSSAPDITNQLQGALGGLKKDGIVVRENGRYFIPEGVEYNKS